PPSHSKRGSRQRWTGSVGSGGIESERHQDVTLPRPISRSVMCTLVFWGLLFLLIQQTERLFLLPETAALERPTTGLLTRTLGTGLVGDIVSATGAVAVGAVLGVLLSVSFFRSRKTANGPGGYGAGLNIALAVVGCLLLVILIVGVGYYGFRQQHLNFLVFQYLEDLLATSRNQTWAFPAFAKPLDPSVN